MARCTNSLILVALVAFASYRVALAQEEELITLSTHNTAATVARAVNNPHASNWGTGPHGLETKPLVWTVDVVDGKCPPSYYLDGPVCRRCAQGHVRAANEESCKICTPGTFADMELHECRPCALGNYAYWHAMTECLWCTPGTYADALGSTICKKCPEGTTSGYQASKCT